MKLTKEKIKPLVQKFASLNGIPPEVVYGIVMTESSGETSATRYEPAFFDRYIVPKHIHDEAEAKDQATSWGLMQVMGSNLRDMGYKDSFNHFLTSPELQIEYGVRFLRGLWMRYFNKWGSKGVIAAYNAGSPVMKKDGTFRNQKYVDKVMKAMKEW